MRSTPYAISAVTGRQVEAADLLEVRELRDLHAVQPDLPAEAPGAEGRALPVVLDEADVVLEQVEPERFRATRGTAPGSRAGTA